MRPDMEPRSTARRDARATRAEERRIEAAYVRRRDGGRYSWFDPGHLFLVQVRVRRVLRLLARHGFSPLLDTRILEVGCGAGQWLRQLIQWGARPELVTGVDLQVERLREARARAPKAVGLACASGTMLGFRDGAFDLVLQATVFTSVLDADIRRAIAREMLRVTRPGGLILWYDFQVNNPRNPDVRGVRGREIAALFPGCRMELRRVTLAPPLARLLAPRAWLLCELLERVPMLCTHLLGAIRVPGGASGEPSHAG